MNIVAEVVEGQTQRVVLQLTETTAAGVTSNLNGTGLTVNDYLLTGKDGEPVDTTSKFGWDSQSGGTVYFDPAAGDFKAEKSPYHVRVRLHDGSGKARFHPDVLDQNAYILCHAQRK